MREQPEKQVLHLSDAYEGKGDIEVTVTMLNVNFGKNQKLMDNCEPLKEYAWFVNAVRRHQMEQMNLEAAVDTAVEEMPADYVIREFIIANRAEVKSMLFTEYNEEKIMEKEREEGAKREREKVAIKMLKENGMTASIISRMTEMPEEAVRKLAKTMGLFIA